MLNFINELETLIETRKQDLPENSYTTKLFKGGLDRILKKVGEEAGEVIIAGKNQDKEEILNETADLVYHLLVFLHQQNLTLADVEAVLKKRHSA
jgi:phosphoribosyl-ATP pyrophosphohydrolase